MPHSAAPIPSIQMTWTAIEDMYGPLEEIGLTAVGRWDVAALRAANTRRLLWTRVEPGLVSTGLHFVNREVYFRAARPYAPGADIMEVDDDYSECVICGGWMWAAESDTCGDCTEATDGNGAQ